MAVGRHGVWKCPNCGHHQIWKTRNHNTSRLDRQCEKCEIGQELLLIDQFLAKVETGLLISGKGQLMFLWRN